VAPNWVAAWAGKSRPYKSTFMPQPPDYLLGLSWETAQQMAAAENLHLIEPLVTAPPRVKVLLGQYRVIGYRQQENNWQLIIAAEQTSAQQFTQKSS